MSNVSLLQYSDIGVSSTKQRLGGEGMNPSPTDVFVGAGFIPAPSGSEMGTDRNSSIDVMVAPS